MRTRGPAVVALLATLLAIGAWLPFLHSVLMPDEAGYLIIAEQWGPGRSLVRRLLGRPAAADHLDVHPGRAVRHGRPHPGRRHRAGHQAARRRSGRRIGAPRLLSGAAGRPGLSAGRTGPRRSSPWRSCRAHCSACRARMASCWRCRSCSPAWPSSSPRWCSPAGGRATAGCVRSRHACAMAAVMVKQNFIDVYVFALVAFVVLSIRREQWLRVFLRVRRRQRCRPRCHHRLGGPAR